MWRVTSTFRLCFGHFLSAVMTENVCSSETFWSAPSHIPDDHSLNLCRCGHLTSLSVDNVLFVCACAHTSDCSNVLMSCVMGRWLLLVCVWVRLFSYFSCGLRVGVFRFILILCWSNTTPALCKLMWKPFTWRFWLRYERSTVKNQSMCEGICLIKGTA
jgi:hypothetical protein